MEVDAPQDNFQKPLVYNRFLPYADQIDGEATQFLQNIKKNLSISLQRRELKRGCVYWVNQLQWWVEVLTIYIFQCSHLCVFLFLVQ